MVERSVPLILDTENLFHAFAYETEAESVARLEKTGLEITAKVLRERREDRASQEEALQKLILGEPNPIVARQHAATVLYSLVTWAENDVPHSLGPRLSFGKDSDGAVARLLGVPFDRSGIKHKWVAPGKDRADDEVISKLYYFADVDEPTSGPLPSFSGFQRPLEQRKAVYVGSEDGKIWRAAANLVDASDDEAQLRYVLILPPGDKTVTKKLYATGRWRVPQDPRDDSQTQDGAWFLWELSSDQAARRKRRIQVAYLHSIHHKAEMRRKRDGDTRRASDAASAVAAPPRQTDWLEVLAKVEAVRLSRPVLGSLRTEWVVSAREILSTVLDEQAEVDQVVRQILNGLESIAISEAILTSLPATSAGTKDDEDEGLWSRPTRPLTGWLDMVFVALLPMTGLISIDQPFPNVPRGDSIRALRKRFAETLADHRGEKAEAVT